MSDGDLTYLEDQTDGRLGRNVVWHDPANRNYPTRGVLHAADAPIKTRTWYRRNVFDQGQESSCTAQAAAGCLFTSPNRMKLDRANLTAFDEPAERYALYKAAQQVDPWPGETYDGSSTDAPFKVLREGGKIAEWRWCFGLDDVLRTLSHHGPVAIGINWYADMFTPDEYGRVKPTGALKGGHAIELVGLSVSAKWVTFVNSWGPSWGDRGRGRLRWVDLVDLLGENGEAVTVVLAA